MMIKTKGEYHSTIDTSSGSDLDVDETSVGGYEIPDVYEPLFEILTSDYDPCAEYVATNRGQPLLRRKKDLEDQLRMKKINKMLSKWD